MRSFLALCAAAGLFSPGCGAPGGSGACTDYTNADACLSDSACHVVGCPDCHGGVSFASCQAIGVNPPIACPAIACAPTCASLGTRSDCVAQPTCEAAGCPNCGGGQTFVGCYDLGKGPIIDCTPCPVCSAFDEGSCTASAQCHAVYSAAPEVFVRCANGPAQCSLSGGPTCAQPSPLCDGNFVVGYENSCPEGCVSKGSCDDCRNSGCAAGESCQLCFGSYTCLLDGDVC